MKRLNAYINKKEITFPHINRKLSIEELEKAVRSFFPLIYDSYRRGNGLALRVIKCLEDLGEATIYMLAKKCNASEPAIINIVRRLEEKQYLSHSVVKGKGPRGLKGRGPRGSYLYKLTLFGKLAYHTIYEQRPITYIIDTLLNNIEHKSIKDTPLSELLIENRSILENNDIKELLDYLFLKYAITRNLEVFFIENKDEGFRSLGMILTGIIAVPTNIFIMEIITKWKSKGNYTVNPYIMILYEIDRESLIPLIPLLLYKKINIIKDLGLISEELGEEFKNKIMKLTINYLKTNIIKTNWITIKVSLNLLFALKQASMETYNKNEVNELKELVQNAEKIMNELLRRLDK